jgi:DNA polymerase III delta subunit
MLYVYYGSDGKSVQKKAFATIGLLKKKQPNATIVPLHLESDGVENVLADMLHTQPLFFEKMIITIDARSAAVPRSKKSTTDDMPKTFDISAHAETIQASPHVVVILLPELTQPLIKVYTKYAEKIEEIAPLQSSMQPALQSVSPFAVTDALYERNAKALFVELEKQRLLGTAPEELLGILTWAVKSMVLAGKVKTAEEAQMKSFPFQKAQRAARLWGSDAVPLLITYTTLLRMSRERGEDPYNALERHALSL